MDELARDRFSRLPRDPFSRLPIEITQTILSFLSTKEAIQKGILSKNFLKACSTISDLDFTYDKGINNVPSASRFLNFVHHTLTRYQEQTIPLKSFRLFTTVCNETANILHQCIRKAREHGGVEEVCLDLRFLANITSSTGLSLLLQILALEQLLVLKLSCCDLAKFVHYDGIIICSSLRILKLANFKTDERALQKLLSSCPLVEELLIHYCTGPKTIQVDSLPNLKRLYFLTVANNQMFYVKAESLELIDYQVQALFPSPYLLTICSTLNLKELSLSGFKNIMENQVLDLIIAESHALEKLILSRCSEIRKLNVSSHSLSFIRLEFCGRLMEVNLVDAPNLNHFELVTIGIPLLSFPSEGSVKRQSSVALHLYDRLEPSSFLQLSELLMKLKRSDNISIYIKSKEINFDLSTIDDSRDSPVPEFEELFISVDSRLSSTYSTLMNGLLWSFSPKILCVICYAKYDKFLKYLCKELLVEYDPNSSTGNGTSFVDWRNYFKQAKFEGRDDEWRPLDSWKCRADALQNLEMNFILKLSSS